jgi:hypothetical protein
MIQEQVLEQSVRVATNYVFSHFLTMGWSKDAGDDYLSSVGYRYNPSAG